MYVHVCEIGLTDYMTKKQIQTITEYRSTLKKYEGTNVTQSVEKMASRNRHLIQLKN